LFLRADGVLSHAASSTTSEPLSDGAAEGNENLALIAVAIDQSLCDRAVDL
jgi:hypothetical protein